MYFKNDYYGEKIYLYPRESEITRIIGFNQASELVNKLNQVVSENPGLTLENIYVESMPDSCYELLMRYRRPHTPEEAEFFRQESEKIEQAKEAYEKKQYNELKKKFGKKTK